MSAQQTNIEFVTELMNYSKHGALVQAFVLVALDNYAAQVLAAPAEKIDNGLISAATWKALAAEVAHKIDIRNKNA